VGKSAVAAHAAREAAAAFEKVVTADDCREDTHAALDTLRAAFDELHSKPQVCPLTVLSSCCLCLLGQHQLTGTSNADVCVTGFTALR
jgi:hypothetical protein